MWRPYGGSFDTGPGVDYDLWALVGAAGAPILLTPFTFALLIALGAVAGLLFVLIARILNHSVSQAVSTRRANTQARTRELGQRVAEQAARLTELEQRLAERDRMLAERDRALKEAADEAERFVRSKSALLARISHELRTSLNAVLGFAQLLEVENLPPPQRAHVDRIIATGQHLIEIIHKAVDLDQVETGHVSLSAEPVGAGEIVQQVVDAVQPLAAEHRVRIRVDQAQPVPHVRADPEQLREVLLGLSSAAIKFSREGEEVTLACEVRDGNRLRIKVSDTRSGIPPGAGPTLAHSRRLVQAMGGAMGAESTPGQGNTFWVEFTTAEGPGVRPEAQESPQPSQSKDRYTVLYIEDNLANLKLVEHVIRKRTRITLISALQGRRGLELAQHHRPDLILLDLQLPDIQGDELLRRLRQNPDTRQIPVVVISADAMPAQIRRLLDAGARAYLTKPIDIAKLLALVDDILNGGPPGAADGPQAPSTIGLTGNSGSSRVA